MRRRRVNSWAHIKKEKMKHKYKTSSQCKVGCLSFCFPERWRIMLCDWQPGLPWRRTPLHLGHSSVLVASSHTPNSVKWSCTCCCTLLKLHHKDMLVSKMPSSFYFFVIYSNIIRNKLIKIVEINKSVLKNFALELFRAFKASLVRFGAHTSASQNALY